MVPYARYDTDRFRYSQAVQRQGGSPQRAGSGRPRNPDIDAAILRAARDLLVDRGYEGMTVEAVARAAGSGKAAVYRRWPSKGALVVAAVRALHRDPDVPDTGSLRDDLLQSARSFSDVDRQSALVLGSLLSEIGRDAELRDAAYEAIGRPPAEMISAVLHRWVERGAIPPSAPIDLVAGLVPALAFRSLVLFRRALDPETVTELVDRVLMPALTGHRGRPRDRR